MCARTRAPGASGERGGGERQRVLRTMMEKPTEVAIAIFMNSARGGGRGESRRSGVVLCSLAAPPVRSGPRYIFSVKPGRGTATAQRACTLVRAATAAIGRCGRSAAATTLHWAMTPSDYRHSRCGSHLLAPASPGTYRAWPRRNLARARARTSRTGATKCARPPSRGGVALLCIGQPKRPQRRASLCLRPLLRRLGRAGSRGRG